jgi:subtilisin family serine protease
MGKKTSKSSTPPRLIQDSPIYLEVWREFRKEGVKRVDLILTPYKGIPTSTLLNLLQQNLTAISASPKNDIKNWKLATTGETIAASLTLYELVVAALPLTQWWQRYFLNKHDYVNVTNEAADSGDMTQAESRSSVLIQDKEETEINFDWLIFNLHSIDKKFSEQNIFFPKISKEGIQNVLWSVSLNRKAFISLFESVPATKADAGRRVFDIDGSDITWAVLDTGIDARHIGFRKFDAASGLPAEVAMGKRTEARPNHTRIIATYDFTSFRELISNIIKFNKVQDKKVNPKLIEELRGFTKSDSNEQPTPSELQDTINLLEAGVRNGRMLEWALIEPFLRIPHNSDDYKFSETPSPHGTHVAGIIGANDASTNTEKNRRIIGMCPNINLYDIRVLNDNGEGEEFNILAAIQFIRWLNSQSDSQVIHGVNLSLSMLHDVDSFAAGRTPICEACQRLVVEGTVVVVAAGNLGLSNFRSASASGRDDTNDGVRVACITDPGNAENVITVGSTHRSKPHTYGVSFFSSRGPTSDGRYKPDLVAPGEKITSLVPGEGNSTKRMDGTSMAAPHVSGAAALLLAKHKELIGNPMKVKEILCKTATDLGRDRYFQGCGMLDVLRALQSV